VFLPAFFLFDVHFYRRFEVPEFTFPASGFGAEFGVPLTF
jgi:hypothetical protein